MEKQVKYTFEFDLVGINTLITACKELPYKQSAGLINYIITEYEKQAKERELAAKNIKKEEEAKEVSEAQ